MCISANFILWYEFCSQMIHLKWYISYSYTYSLDKDPIQTASPKHSLSFNKILNIVHKCPFTHTWETAHLLLCAKYIFPSISQVVYSAFHSDFCSNVKASERPSQPLLKQSNPPHTPSLIRPSPDFFLTFIIYFSIM